MPPSTREKKCDGGLEKKTHPGACASPTSGAPLLGRGCHALPSPWHVFCLPQEYKLLFEGAGSNPGDKTLEDRFFEHEVSWASV